MLNTCSVREHAEDRAISQLGRLKKLRSRGRDFKIAVMGCMVGQRDDDLHRRFPYVDAFARPQDFEPILEIAGIDDTRRRVLARRRSPRPTPSRRSCP